MIRKVYTYTDLTKLPENEYFKEIAQYPIITVSADFRKGFVGSIGLERKEEVLSYLDKQAGRIWELAKDDAALWEQNFVEEYDYLREWLSNRFDYFDEFYGGMSELDKHML